MKKCTKCLIEKDESEFHKRSTRNGLSARCKEYERKRLRDYKRKNRERIRLANAISKNSKSGSAVNDLGCSIPQLKQHLEQQFYPHPKIGEEMTWENHGLYGWHIDHIKPLALFDLTDREQLLEACHYTNLQPLWAEENLRKGASYVEKEC